MGVNVRMSELELCCRCEVDWLADSQQSTVEEHVHHNGVGGSSHLSQEMCQLTGDLLLALRSGSVDLRPNV